MLYLLIKSGEEMLKIDRHSYILNELKNKAFSTREQTSP